ncbi:MAG: cation diffusion facilitator family transporter [Balneolaceae bacterium]
MAHDHSHHPVPKGDKAETRLWISIFLNLGITIVEIVGGILSNSLALISDAIHNFSDTTSLGVSLTARKVSKWNADKQKTFGYKRAEIVGAFFNLVVLVVIGLFLVKEAIERFYSPEIIDGVVMLWVAVFGLAANLVSMLLLHGDAKDNLNIKSAYVHLFWDTISSVAVIAGGIVVWLYQLYIVDTILTIAIALYILYHCYFLLKQTIDILMESTPDHLDIDEIESAIESLNQVLDVHHIHVWNLNETNILLECHVRIREDHIDNLEIIKSTIKKLLSERFEIFHSTLEFELKPCEEVTSEPCL